MSYPSTAMSSLVIVSLVFQISQWLLSSGKLIQSFPVHDGAAGPYVYSIRANHKQIQTPRDKILALNSSNTHLLTCHNNGARLYKVRLTQSLVVTEAFISGGHPALFRDNRPYFRMPVLISRCLSLFCDAYPYFGTLVHIPERLPLFRDACH